MAETHEHGPPLYDAVVEEHGDPEPMMKRPRWTLEAAKARLARVPRQRQKQGARRR